MVNNLHSNLLSASLVLYGNKEEIFQNAITSFLNGFPAGLLYIVDNSTPPIASNLFSHPRVVYIHSGSNIGFGAGHNLAFRHVSSRYHLILNPDIKFGQDVLPSLLNAMISDGEIGAIMPKIIYPNGDPQHLCKLLPSPFDLFRRRFLLNFFKSTKWLSKYELWGLPQSRCSEVPSLSGCFLLLRTELLIRLNGFDQRYFMYMEDVDLIRRIGECSKVIFYPHKIVIHDYEKGSYKNIRLLLHHIKSACLYFNKWGWVFDRQRQRRNRSALELIKD